MTASTYRFSAREFLIASEAGAFDQSVELVNGQIYVLASGRWRNRTAARVVRALPDDADVMVGALSVGGSLLHPDGWVGAPGSPDVLLVVEVVESATDVYPVTPRVRACGAAGCEVYWEVSPDGDPRAHATERDRLLGPPGIPAGHPDPGPLRRHRPRS